MRQANLAPDLFTQVSCLPLKRSGTWECTASFLYPLWRSLLLRAEPLALSTKATAFCDGCGGDLAAGVGLAGLESRL